MAKKLDGDLLLPFSVVNIPLLIALTSLVLRSFNARGGNLWWCGMQKDFYLFLFDMIPFLREYANVSYHQPDQRSLESSDFPEITNLSYSGSPTLAAPKTKTYALGDFRTVVPVLVLDIPD